MNRIRILSLFFAILFSSNVLLAQDPPEEKVTEYVSINVEFTRVDESLDLLQSSIATLSSSLTQAAQSPGDLSVEQIQALESLITKSDVLIVSLERALNQVGPMIGNAKQPAQEVVSALLDKARVEAIDPTILSIERTGRHWIMLIIIGLILIVTFVGLALYFMTRQLREFAQILKAISNDYEIVRRSK